MLIREYVDIVPHSENEKTTFAVIFLINPDVFVTKTSSFGFGLFRSFF
jgi:hypothetical protein